MFIMKKVTTLLVLSLAIGLQAQQHVMTVDVSKPLAKIQPTMYGIFLRILILVPMEDCMLNW